MILNFVLLFFIMILNNIGTSSENPMTDTAIITSEKQTTEISITSPMPEDFKNGTDTLFEKPIIGVSNSNIDITVTTHSPGSFENGTDIHIRYNNESYTIHIPPIKLNFNFNYSFSMRSSLFSMHLGKSLTVDKEAKWRKIADQYIQGCKTQENANDEDIKIFANQQMPANEVQSCLLQCLDTKTGMVKDGKLNIGSYMEAAIYALGVSKEKLEEAKFFFKKCKSEVEKKTVEKCGAGAAMRACIIELAKHH